MTRRPQLSVVVISYNMERELPRTLYSLSPKNQIGIASEDYEIIVIDNGSTQHISKDSITLPNTQIRWYQANQPSCSPVRAINQGIRLAEGDLICVFIDGARLASPRLLSGALLASQLNSRAVIASLGFHLGPAVQMTSVTQGYNQEVEDLLLQDSGWVNDGYRLFEICVFAGSSIQGWFGPIAESNALFLPRPLWSELDGFDDKFISPGGGLANLDLYKRACTLLDIRLVVLLGEGTFHQVHGGIATNSSVSQWQVFHEEYINIRGQEFDPPAIEPVYLGWIRPQVLPLLKQSLGNKNAGHWKL